MPDVPLVSVFDKTTLTRRARVLKILSENGPQPAHLAHPPCFVPTVPLVPNVPLVPRFLNTVLDYPEHYNPGADF